MKPYTPSYQMAGFFMGFDIITRLMSHFKEERKMAEAKSMTQLERALRGVEEMIEIDLVMISSKANLARGRRSYLIMPDESKVPNEEMIKMLCAAQEVERDLIADPTLHTAGRAGKKVGAEHKLIERYSAFSRISGDWIVTVSGSEWGRCLAWAELVGRLVGWLPAATA
jgi:hypothetical protein